MTKSPYLYNTVSRALRTPARAQRLLRPNSTRDPWAARRANPTIASPDAAAQRGGPTKAQAGRSDHHPWPSPEMGTAAARRSLLLSSVAALMLSSCPGPGAALPAAEGQSEAPEEEYRPLIRSFTSAVAVAEVARNAQLICGAAPVQGALLSVRLQPGEATDAAGQLLEGLGLRTAVDLRLLGGGPEAFETMNALKAAGISIGDRSKIRMLVGDRAHLESAEWRNCCGRIRPRSRWVMPLRNVVPQAPQTRPLWTRAVLNLPAVVWCSGRRWPGYKKSTRRGAAPSRQIRTHSSGSGTRALGTLCWLRGLKMTSPPCGLERPRRH